MTDVRLLLLDTSARTESREWSVPRREIEQLDTWIALGKTCFADWAVGRHDLSRAVAYVRGAGAAVLLVPEVLAALDVVRARLRAGDIELAGSVAAPARAPAPISPQLEAIARGPVAREFAGLNGLDEVFTTIDKGMRTIDSG